MAQFVAQLRSRFMAQFCSWGPWWFSFRRELVSREFNTVGRDDSHTDSKWSLCATNSAFVLTRSCHIWAGISGEKHRTYQLQFSRLCQQAVCINGEEVPSNLPKIEHAGHIWSLERYFFLPSSCHHRHHHHHRRHYLYSNLLTVT